MNNKTFFRLRQTIIKSLKREITYPNLNIYEEHRCVFGGRGVEDALLLPEERHDPVVLLQQS